MVYIRWNNDGEDVILELTVTTEVTVNETTSVTAHPLQAGVDIADHLVNKNKNYSFKGMVSNIKSYIITTPDDDTTEDNLSGNLKPNQKDVFQYFADLDRLRRAKTLVVFYFDPAVDNDGIPDCVIKSINYTRKPSHGDAYLVNIELEQVRITESFETYEERSMKTPDLNADEKTNGATSTVSERPNATFALGSAIEIGITEDNLGTNNDGNMFSIFQQAQTPNNGG